MTSLSLDQASHRPYVFQAEMHAFHNPINDSVLASDH